MAKWTAAQKRFFAHCNFDLYSQLDKWGSCALGFDLSSTSTGYGVVSLEDGSFIDSGTIEFSRDDGTDYERYFHFYENFVELIRTYEAHILSFEAIRVKQSTASFQMLSQVLSCFQIARSEVMNHDRETFSLSLTPTPIKKCAGVDRHASKQEVIAGVNEAFDIGRDINDDQADALACARAAYCMNEAQPVYSSIHDFSVDGHEEKYYDFLLDIFKRRHDLFESSLSHLDNDCIDSLLGCISGKAGLKCLTRNDIEKYYEARDKANEIYE